MNLRVIIAEDEPHARDVLKVYLSDIAETTLVAECTNGRETVEAIRMERPDLLFLDIQMPDLDGFGVLRELGREQMPAVVFVTAYDQFAVKAFEAQALDYLLKPFSKERFLDALSRVRKVIMGNSLATMNERIMAFVEGEEKKSGARAQRFVVKENGKIVLVPYANVDWIKAAGDYAELHVGTGKHLLNESMARLEEILEGHTFLRIHRSIIVNTDRIKEIEPRGSGDFSIRLSTGKQLKLSRNYRKALETFLNHPL